MSELENYLEANYSVKDVLNKVKRKSKRSNDFGEPDSIKTKFKLENKESSPQNGTFKEDWINVETKEAVSITTESGFDEAVGAAGKKIENNDKKLISEVITEKSGHNVNGLQSDSKATNSSEKSVDLLKVPTNPKKSRKHDSKNYRIEKSKQVPVHRDRYGKRMHGYQPLTPKQQRKQNESEREQRIRELNKDEYTEQLNKLNAEQGALSQDVSTVNAEGIREEDPALLFDKSVKQSFKDTAIKQRLTSICGRKLYKDESLYPLNRFGLVPGALWDGIDRGNGYEKKWLQKQVEKTQEDASGKVISNEDNSF